MGTATATATSIGCTILPLRILPSCATAAQPTGSRDAGGVDIRSAAPAAGIISRCSGNRVRFTITTRAPIMEVGILPHRAGTTATTATATPVGAVSARIPLRIGCASAEALGRIVRWTAAATTAAISAVLPRVGRAQYTRTATATAIGGQGVEA